MDGTTDLGKVEELVVAFYCKKDDVSKSCARYLSVVTPNKADANGLVNCLGEDWRLKMSWIEMVFLHGTSLFYRRRN